MIACCATSPLANRAAARSVAVAWSSSDEGDELIRITFAINGRVVARDVLCCEP
jgi:hypothetical protein